jgi:oxygen-independent coproporphyrinogen III oxidase
MPAGVYLHIPFCKSRCSYCDFATDVYRDSSAVDRYVDALIREIGASHAVSARLSPSQPVSGVPGISAQDETRRTTADTVYFGGGTPSLLTPEQAGDILKAVRGKFDIDPDAEITMEMNPATVTPETLAAYRDLGINRASFGVQTFNDRDLKLLARGHDANDARETYRLLREAGFSNISFDLIAGLPGQTLDDWSRNLDEAIAMAPEHLSLYLLEIHEATPLAKQLRSGRRPLPDDDLAADMYEMMIDRLTAAGYRHYEISNFARPGYESRHNTKYWRLEPVYGFGVSAHSFDGRERYANERDTARYVEMIEAEGTAEVMREEIDLASETAFLGLRLEDGLDLTKYSELFGFNPLEKYSTDLEQFSDAGLIDISGERLRLTRRGKLNSNEVFALFV